MTCKRCKQPWEGRRRNGLRLSRLCDKCLSRKPLRTSVIGHRKQYGRLSGSKRLAKSRLKCDKLATESAKFLDLRSYVHITGRFFCFGADMSDHRKTVLKRDEYTCQKCYSAYSGAQHMLEIDHITPRSKGRDDKISNLQTLCRPCHRQKHGRVLHFSRRQG